jgi:hypothetical protein
MSIPFDPPRPRPAGGGGGGAAGFTPVLFTAQWNASRQQSGSRAVEPDTILLQEGITSGNGTDNIPYGWSYSTIPANAGSNTYWKISEEMAGIYTFTIRYTAERHAQYPNGEHGPPLFKRRRAGTTTTLIVSFYDEAFNEDADKRTMFTATLTTRLIAEDRIEMMWGAYAFTLDGGSTSSPRGRISVVKVLS